MANAPFYRILHFGFLIVSVFFLASLSVLPFPLFVILKVTPALLAALIALVYGDPHKKTLIFFIFIFLGTGDFFMGIGRTRFFMFSLSSFLVGNTLLLIYLIPFATKKATSLIRASVIVVFSIIIGVNLIPNSGTYLLPVFFYFILICSMAFISALNIKGRHWLIFAGAISFMLSDSLIAFDKFVHPVHGSLPIILALYYISVYCFCFGIITPPVITKSNSNLAFRQC